MVIPSPVARILTTHFHTNPLAQDDEIFYEHYQLLSEDNGISFTFNAVSGEGIKKFFLIDFLVYLLQKAKIVKNHSCLFMIRLM